MKTILLLLATFALSSCGLIKANNISNMNATEIQKISNSDLCHRYADGDVVEEERKRRGLDDCDPAAVECVNLHYTPGTAVFLQCIALQKHQDAANRQIYMQMMQTGAQMETQPPDSATSSNHIICTNNSMASGTMPNPTICQGF